MERVDTIADWERQLTESITNLVIGPPVIIYCIDSISQESPVAGLSPPRYPHWQWGDDYEKVEKVNWTKEGF